MQDARCLKFKPRERAFKRFKSPVLNVLTSGVGGQLHASAVLPSGKRTGTHCRGGWVDSRAGLDGCDKFRPYRNIFRWAISVVYRISVINKSKSNTTRTGIVFYSTTCFDLSLLDHHQVVASLLRELYSVSNTLYCIQGTVQFIQHIVLYKLYSFLNKESAT